MTTQLSMGMRVEKEHAKTIAFIKKYHRRYGRFPINKEVYKHIAKDHISEDKKYYSKLKKAKL
uniref:Uncharacterized protein n=1 Tax=viral metagenome TaxID=1070528 RepID=A0A6M3M453_9ZZZZ